MINYNSHLVVAIFILSATSSLNRMTRAHKFSDCFVVPHRGT